MSIYASNLSVLECTGVHWSVCTVGDITVHVVPRNIPSRFSSNFEADASELLEILEDILPRYFY